MDATDRGNLIIKLANMIEENRELFATIDTWDNGTEPLTCIFSSTA